MKQFETDNEIEIIKNFVFLTLSQYLYRCMGEWRGLFIIEQTTRDFTIFSRPVFEIPDGRLGDSIEFTRNRMFFEHFSVGNQQICSQLT